MTQPDWQEILLRLVVALLLSGSVGLQRYLAGKAAGIRTHALVGVGAALFTLISPYAFPTAASNADRIASQVVTGIGFIGGGAILKEGVSIRGLTTAAGLWAAASLGMAAGAGLWAIAFLGAAVILGTLIILRYAEGYLPQNPINLWTIKVTLADSAAVERVRAAIEAEAKSVELETLQSAGEMEATFSAELQRTTQIDRLATTLRSIGARSVTCQVIISGNAERGA